ncbi:MULTISPECIES: acyl-CoA dehydrogenase family protein [unclassified Minwuia]|jgi:alkylation response protein AidB-like acyl-CoA dehydrogenase|uniref:acyl-CoA dehydrogenase family protein n=1 Tax=unclassified Minwuia TaxID=2618799 RepID=UPI002478E142|nr:MULTISPECIES: acyl-CoA dehydrogenase family protein [unclassified Minwuia]
MTTGTDDLLNSPPARAQAPTEEAWRAAWDAAGLSRATPVVQAVSGGLRADHLDWVFASGYQAAMRHCFPELPAGGWAALAASEDRHEPEKHPGVMLTRDGDTWRVNGFKSWVAQSRHLDHLIITARAAGEEQEKPRHAILLDSQAPGVTLSHRDKAGFLPRMSQGFAAMDNVAVPEAGRLGDNRLRPFVRAESAYVLLAGAAFLWAHVASSHAELADRLRQIVTGLDTCCQDPMQHPKEIARLDLQIQEIVKNVTQIPEIMQIPDWKSDQKVLSIYSEGLQRRAARS